MKYAENIQKITEATIRKLLQLVSSARKVKTDIHPSFPVKYTKQPPVNSKVNLKYWSEIFLKRIWRSNEIRKATNGSPIIVPQTKGSDINKTFSKSKRSETP